MPDSTPTVALIDVLDTDGTLLARMTPGVAERHAPHHVPTVCGRLAPPELAAALAQAAAVAVHTGHHADFWQAVLTMDEPAGIRSSLA